MHSVHDPFENSSDDHLMPQAEDVTRILSQFYDANDPAPLPADEQQVPFVAPQPAYATLDTDVDDLPTIQREKGFPYLAVSILVIAAVLMTGGVVGYSTLTRLPAGQAGSTAPQAAVLADTAAVPEPTAVPTPSYKNPFALGEADKSTLNPFGTYENPFAASIDQPATNTNTPYQNPFEEQK